MEKDNFCFCCGGDNPRGLHLEIRTGGDGDVFADFTPPPFLQGYRNVLHGGIVSTLLDELMAHAAFRAVRPDSAATARIEVTFRRPALTGETVRVTGAVESIRGRRINTVGRIQNLRGEIVAEARALFLRVQKGGESPDRP